MGTADAEGRRVTSNKPQPPRRPPLTGQTPAPAPRSSTPRGPAPVSLALPTLTTVATLSITTSSTSRRPLNQPCLTTPTAPSGSRKSKVKVVKRSVLIRSTPTCSISPRVPMSPVRLPTRDLLVHHIQVKPVPLTDPLPHTPDRGHPVLELTEGMNHPRRTQVDQ